MASYFSEGRGLIFLDDVFCQGNERTLIDCDRGTSVGIHNCEHSADVGVRCLGNSKLAIMVASTVSPTLIWTPEMWSPCIKASPKIDNSIPEIRLLDTLQSFIQDFLGGWGDIPGVPLPP